MARNDSSSEEDSAGGNTATVATQGPDTIMVELTDSKAKIEKFADICRLQGSHKTVLISLGFSDWDDYDLLRYGTPDELANSRKFSATQKVRFQQFGIYLKGNGKMFEGMTIQHIIQYNHNLEVAKETGSKAADSDGTNGVSSGSTVSNVAVTKSTHQVKSSIKVPPPPVFDEEESDFETWLIRFRNNVGQTDSATFLLRAPDANDDGEIITDKKLHYTLATCFENSDVSHIVEGAEEKASGFNTLKLLKDHFRDDNRKDAAQRRLRDELMAVQLTDVDEMTPTAYINAWTLAYQKLEKAKCGMTLRKGMNS